MLTLGALLVLRDRRSQEVLAGLVGISRQQLSRIVHGHSDPSYKTRLAFRAALGIPVDAWDRPGSAPLRDDDELEGDDSDAAWAGLLQVRE